MEFAVAFGPRAAVYGHGAIAADSFVSLDRLLMWEGARAGAVGWRPRGQRLDRETSARLERRA